MTNREDKIILGILEEKRINSMVGPIKTISEKPKKKLKNPRTQTKPELQPEKNMSTRKI